MNLRCSDENVKISETNQNVSHQNFKDVERRTLPNEGMSDDTFKPSIKLIITRSLHFTR